MGLADRLSDLQRLRSLRGSGVRVPLFAGVNVNAGSVAAPECRIARGASLFESSLGRFSYVGRDTRLSYADVGTFCAIAWHASIGAPNHPLDRATTHGFPYLPTDGAFVREPLVEHRRTLIGHDVWVGANAVVLPGVTVGSGCVVSASAVVTHDVDPYSVVAGVPARTLRLRIPDELVERMLALRWWEWPRERLQEHLALFQRPLDERVVAGLEAAAP
ncbi:MAG: hypothetical protein QOF69_4143 [Solirubrobacteraceae bacterium]|jgi:acetyltransferase-like isoleucine patch superfamily enzyme|nr:hypothetical protein [Solirubrobacteraceae bacterium]